MDRRSAIRTTAAGLMGAAFAGVGNGTAHASLGQSGGVAGAVFNRAPLASQPYAPLPLGSVRAKGWLAGQLRTMANGIGGHLDRYYPLVGTDNAWLGGPGDAWERGPYWLDGLVPLAHILDDKELKAKAAPWIEHALASQQPSGYFGPPDDRGTGRDTDGKQRSNAADWWPRMVMLKVLQQHYDASGDVRVLRLMERYFAFQRKQLPANPLNHWTEWARHRGGENLESVLWLYNRSGDASLLGLARTLMTQTSDWTSGFAAEQPPSIHAVNVAMGMKAPAIAYLVDGDRAHLDAIAHGLAFLDREHGQVTGMFSGDEPLHGTDPLQGTELCTVVEFMFSLEMLGRITGDVAWLDRLERVAYNALPTQVTRDYTARQYFQQPNQVLIAHGDDHYVQHHGGTSHLVGLLDGYPCCTVNMHQGWPKFVHSLWAASADGGLAVLAYGPSVAHATINGVRVEAEQTAAYPFEDAIRVSLRPAHPARFPLHLRVPAWAKGATLAINGGPATAAAPGTIIRLDRTWRAGDTAVLNLPAEIRRTRWHNQLMSLERGPLVYALAIGEDWRKLREVNGIASSEVHPTTAWNYALDEQAPLRLDRATTVAPDPWTTGTAPISLTTTGRRIPGWDRYHYTHGSLPPSPVATARPSETLRLVPYGCTMLRMSEFPVVRES